MGKPPRAEGSLLDYHGVYSGYLLNLEKQRFIGREAKTCRTVGFGEVSLGFVPGYGTTPSVLIESQPPTLEVNKDFPGAQQEFYFCLLLTRIPFTQSLQLLAPHPIATTPVIYTTYSHHRAQGYSFTANSSLQLLGVYFLPLLHFN